MVADLTLDERARELTRSRSVVAARDAQGGDLRTSGGPIAPGLGPGATDSALLLFAANAGDTFIPWGVQPKARDRQLRSFWRIENWLASAVATVAQRNAAMSWTVTGDPESAQAAQEMLLNANFGGGWEEFVMQTTIDALTQDSGAFVELIRLADSPVAPVIGIAHLDAARCFPTGVPDFPVLYENSDGENKLMPWYSVVQLLELAEPTTFSTLGYFYKLQLSAVSRVLTAAQILRNIGIYKEEKTGGRFTRAIDLVGGFTQAQLTAAAANAETTSDQRLLTRFAMIPVIASVDPEMKIDHKRIDFAGLPDAFDEKETHSDYLAILSNALGLDYQDLAPLPGGNLGTSQQSETLHQKSRGRGAGLWQKLYSRMMNVDGALPQNVEFEFTEPDIEAEVVQADLEQKRATTRQIRLDSGEITVEEARQIAVDEGDLSRPIFEAAGGRDITAQETLDDEEQAGATGVPEQVEGEKAVGFKQGEVRAGPDSARLAEEEEAADAMERGLRDMGRQIRRSLRREAATIGALNGR